jgi:hypothetical protein
LSFQQAELYCIRGLPGDLRLEAYINQRKHYETMGIVRRSGLTKFTPEVTANLHQTQAVLTESGAKFKLVVSGSYGSVYTSDLNLVNAVCQLPHATIGNLRTANVTLPRDTVVVRNPKFQYRTYFREREVSTDCKDTLGQWLNSQQGQVRPSPAVQQWLSSSNHAWRSKYMQRYYYVEHNSLQYETMLSLVIPGYVRKTVPIISSDK